MMLLAMMLLAAVAFVARRVPWDDESPGRGRARGPP